MSRQATGKATIAPVARRKGGKTFYCARGAIPIRKPNGDVGSRRIERGFGADITTEAKRREKCAEWNREYEERFRNPRQMITFARAYKNYIGKKHAVPMYAERILEAIGTMQCQDIDDTAMDELAEDLWPDGAMPATINRHLYSPVISILHIALKEKAPELTRPAGHRDVTPVIIPPVTWYVQLAPHLNANQLAFVMLLCMHGRRTGEMLARRPKDLNVELGLLDLGKTKTGVRQLELHPKVIPLLLAMPGWEERKWLFSAGPKSGNSFRRDLRAACRRAGLDWFHPHSFGRHTSVTRMLRAGYSTKHVADAHGMTEQMVSRRYGHLTLQETTAALHEVGGDLFDRIINGGSAGDGKVIPLFKISQPHVSVKKLTKSAAPELQPSEGDALSNCATGAEENPSVFSASSVARRSFQDSTGQEQTDVPGGNAGTAVRRPRPSRSSAKSR
jgi:integrase